MDAAVSTSRQLARTPVWSVLVLTFLCSAAGLITTGVYYITKETYDFSKVMNYALAFMQGVTYIAGALAAGPVLRLLCKGWRISTRTVLLALMLIMAAFSTIPWLAIHLGTPDPSISGQPSTPAAWPIWLLIALYSPLTGMLWPVVESYLSGGKSGHGLRSCIGIWNVIWSGALVAMSVLIAPYIEGKGDLAILAGGGFHVASIIPLLYFGREPEPHPHEAHAARTQASLLLGEKLLVTFRMLLPTSYLVTTALTPFLPTQMDRLGIDAKHYTILGATWLAARVLGFVILERWHGWHERWWPTIVAPLLLLAGLAASVFSHLPMAAGPEGQAAATAILVVGLVLHGLAMATIYTGAIFYAMEVGTAQVDAGGTHEALIGVGYSAGPICGLLAAAVITATGDTADFEPLLMGLVGSAALLMAGLTARRVLRVGTPLK
jgi:hypothetical protein